MRQMYKEELLLT